MTNDEARSKASSAADRLCQRSLALWEKYGNLEHPRAASCLCSYDLLHCQQGKHAEGMVFLRQALATRLQILGENHPDLAQSFHGPAVLYQALGKDAEAEPLLHKALVIREKMLIPQHPDLVRNREDYTRLLRRLNRHDETNHSGPGK